MAYTTRRTFADNYTQARTGRSPVFKIGFAALMGGILGGPFGAIAAGGVTAGIVGGFRAMEALRGLTELSKPETATQVVDTRAASTMRQASLKAMHDSMYNLRAILGNEASLIHR